MKPLVSVIMPTYNHADFVKRAIDSVLMQENVDFEFIIVDDGSSDTTRDVIRTVSDSRIKFYPNEVNRGAALVTNELINYSSGEFIALINSDDEWIGKDKLSYQLEILQNDPKLGACFGRARFIDKDNQPILKSSLPFGSIFDQENRSQGFWLRRFFDLGNCICHPAMLIRKSCYQELGAYNNRLRQLPDFDMWIRLIKKHPIFISDRELINFRILPGENASSQTTANSFRSINEHLLLAEEFFHDVTREQLIDGFYDVLTCKDIPTETHLEIEKTLLYFGENRWLGGPYKIIGILQMNKILNDPAKMEILKNEYKIDDRWFQQKMGEIGILKHSVDEVEALSQEMSKIYNSKSWRVTAPLRRGAQILSSLKSTMKQ